ncbi:hypothetical protein L7F22_021796 [Adiantum nelumboides]|nr:hypothetical protein [Adiantum nelumboides]
MAPTANIHSSLQQSCNSCYSSHRPPHMSTDLASSDPEEDESGHHADEEQLLDYTCCTACPYSLTSGPLTQLPVAHETASSPSSPSRLQQERPAEPPINPFIHPFDHIKTLLSQLGSSISTLKSAFNLVRASSSTSSCTTSAENASRAAALTAMADQLQTFSHLHMKLYSLIQLQCHFGMNQDRPYETSSRSISDESNMGLNAERPVKAMLVSYEGIISRFHDEIRKKDAVIEALKETLARATLKAEKLERQTKVLEGLERKISEMQLK